MNFLRARLEQRRIGSQAQFDPTIDNTFQQLRDAGYEVRIAGSLHLTFMDTPLLVDKFNGPEAAPGSVGTIDPRRAISIMNAYDLAFFEKHLTGMTEPLLDGPTPYTEVTFTKR